MQTNSEKEKPKKPDFQAVDILEAMDFERGEELTVPIVRTQDVLPVGKSIFVRWLGQREKIGSERMNDKTGEFEKPVYTMFKFIDPKGSIFEMFADAGMRNALEAFPCGESATFIELERLDKKDLGGGQTCNQYKVYSVKPKGKK